MVYMYSGSPIDTIYVSANGKQILDRIPNESPSSQPFSPEISLNAKQISIQIFPVPATATATSLLISLPLSSLLASSLHSCLGLVHDSLRRVDSLVLQLLSGLKGRALLAALPHEDTGNLNDTHASEEEVNGGKTKKSEISWSQQNRVDRSRTYRTLRGLIIRHQRVQMAPVAIRAQFWVKDSFSAGRLKSEIPAMTRAHYSRGEISHVLSL